MAQRLILIHPITKKIVYGDADRYASHTDLAYANGIHAHQEDDYIHLCYSNPREFPETSDVLGIPCLSISSCNLDFIAIERANEWRELLNDLSNSDITNIIRLCKEFDDRCLDERLVRA